MMNNIDTAETVSVGQYLAERLVQIGAAHVFGLPGDFNLTLLDEMTAVAGLTWVGSSNELNAAYAADGYARVGRHPAAVITTFGVGELSAINGIAGAFAEDVPVLHIGGMPARSAMGEGAPLHHTFLDGDFDRFVRMFSEVTVAQAVLSGGPSAPIGDAIDRVLGAMLTASKPGYLGIPLDVAAERIPAAALARPLSAAQSDQRAVAAFASALKMRVAASTDVTVLAGPRVHRRALEAQVSALADLAGVRIATQTGSKAILDEQHPASLGTYLGATTRSAESRYAVDHADLLVMIGTVFSDFTTGFFTHGYDPAVAVELALDHARVGHAVYPGVRIEDSLAVLREIVGQAPFPVRPAVRVPATRSGPSGRYAEHSHGDGLADDRPLDHSILWPEIQNWLAPDCTVVAEAGTAFYGAIDLDLPARSDLLGQPVWSSIGFTLPAAFGAGLARPDRRPVLLIGDGSAQLTVQELGHLFGHGLHPVIFLIDNDGYTVERMIQSPDAAYQDIVRWNWESIPTALGASDVTVASVATVGELRNSLAAARDRGSSHFIRVVMPKLDAPRLLVALAEGISATNSAP